MKITLPPEVPSLSTASSAHEISTQQRLWKFREERVLGTRLEMLVKSSDPAIAKSVAHAARGEIERLNAVLNDRLESTEISRLHRERRIEASADLFAVLRLGETWRKISHGAFDGRLGELVRLWKSGEPDRAAIERVLATLCESMIALDPIGRGVKLSSAVMLALDAVAKGYIVDAALNAARRAVPLMEGMAIGIGGDIRCFGDAPDARGWRIGIPDPMIPAENAPLADAVILRNAAIATSGRGPRDWSGKGYRSTTLSPFTGCPVTDVISASVIASHAADADAIATACLVRRPEETIAWIDGLDGIAARITDSRGAVYESRRWQTVRLAAIASEQTQRKKNAQSSGKGAKETQQSVDNSATNAKPSLPPEQRWPADWEVGITFSEPKVKDLSAGFTVPYIGVWITDTENKPIRTVILIGRDEEWHHDNFIWWDSHRERAKDLVDLISRPTSLSGHYRMYWNGMDEDSKPVPLGKYIVHLETNQEKGKHTYRSFQIEVGRERFKTSLPNLKDEGGLEIAYGHYNDREY